MGKSKSVTLSVHRGIVDDSFPWTLASLLDRLKKDASIGGYVVDRGLFDKTAVRFPSIPETNSAVAAIFAQYEEGAEKSTIRPGGTTEAYSTEAIRAPEETEFLNGEVAVLAQGNYLIACGLGRRRQLLVDAITEMAVQRGIRMHATALAFADTPNKLSVEKIRSVGVHSIKFDAANFLGSLDISTPNLIGTIFGASTTAEEFERREMVAELHIHPQPLKRTALETVETPKDEWLNRAAVKTFEDEEVSSYTIVLNDGTVWNEGNLKLRETVEVTKDGSTIFMPETLQKMRDYLDRLEKGGYLC